MEAEVASTATNEDSLPRLDVPHLAPTDRLVSIPPQGLRDATTGAEPRLRTAVRVGVRDGLLLVRFDGRDDGVVATLRNRDDPLWTEDVYEVFLTPLDPPVRYFEFEINPLGALFDARVESPDLARRTMSVDTGWNLAGLQGTSRVREGRWSATLKIPIAPLLEGGAAPRLWRANFYRVDRGTGNSRDEFSAWSPVEREPADFHEASRFGRLNLPD
ncbi:MAG TPA: carbohydrate-binding family 9-like protein [Thermoanaerobaculia bacterium]